MADPVIVPLAADTWVKVATGVTSGAIHRLSLLPNLHLQVIRDTTNPAPTDNTEAVPVFVGDNTALISSVAAIDVYIKAVGAIGSVRADL